MVHEGQGGDLVIPVHTIFKNLSVASDTMFGTKQETNDNTISQSVISS
jgi:hypothetical protein